MKKIYRIFIITAFVLFLLLVRFVSDIEQDHAPQDRFNIAGIIDGDTFRLRGGDRLRLLGIDCPEKGEPYYDSAITFVESMALGKTAEVGYSHRRRDRYGRLLGYAHVDDSIFVNAEIIRNGLAYVYLFDDNLADSGSVAALVMAQNEAINNGRGIWSIPHTPEPFYVAGKRSHRFHRPACQSASSYNAENWIRFDTREEAFRLGYSPCRNCRP
ncbi:MAG: thermonuclease family protein [Candidatus Zixiibacteriota bacterium]